VGNKEKGFNFLEKAVKIQEKTFGSSHPDVGIALANLGDAYMVNNDFYSALNPLRRSVSIAREFYPSNHPKLMTRSYQLALTLHQLGCYFESLEYSELTYRLHLELKGKYHIRTGDTFYLLSKNLYKTGLLEDSTKYLAVTEKIYQESGIGDQNLLAKIEQELFERSIMFIKHQKEKSFPSTSEVGSLEFIDIAYKHLDTEIKEDLLSTGLMGLINSCGTDHPYVVECYDKLAFKSFEEEDYKRALEYAVKSYDILLEKLGEKHPRTEQASIMVGNIRICLGSQFFRKDDSF
jgi:tetratricopeptide (TPR) repeat protein